MTHAALISEARIAPITLSADAPRAMSSDIPRNAHVAMEDPPMFVLRDEVFRQTLRYSLQGGALLVLFSAALQSSGVIRTVLSSRPLRFIALLSYTLYLIHMPMLRVAHRLELPFPPAFAYLFALTYAYAMYRLVERPLARWRQGVEKRQAAKRLDPAKSAGLARLHAEG